LTDIWKYANLKCVPTDYIYQNEKGKPCETDLPLKKTISQIFWTPDYFNIIAAKRNQILIKYGMVITCAYPPGIEDVTRI